MGTRATIAIELQDGRILQTYLHQDGYPINEGGHGAGITLLKHYKSAAKVGRLVRMGAISSLRANTGSKNLKHKKDTDACWYRENKITRFAKRDMSDPEGDHFWNGAPPNKEYANRREYLCDEGWDYDYLFTKEKPWLLTKPYGLSLHPLALYLATRVPRTELSNMCK